MSMLWVFVMPNELCELLATGRDSNDAAVPPAASSRGAEGVTWPSTTEPAAIPFSWFAQYTLTPSVTMPAGLETWELADASYIVRMCGSTSAGVAGADPVRLAVSAAEASASRVASDTVVSDEAVN